ncbi:MAG TPA: lactate racemase domain-containing protein [Roseiflexaceae bacterium]
MREFPRLAAIRQPVPAAPIADVAQAVRDELARIDLGSRIAPGAQIAVGAGSRGITDYALIVRTVVEELRKLGAAPFVFAAMGSHGGATAEGQRAVLAEWGITPERMGCDVRSSMEVVRVGETSSGIAVFCDTGAFASDGIVLVNRVKIHTDFHGPTESGLTKMLAIGLGKREGAELIHARGTRGLREEIPRVAAVHLARSPILCGVAIVEDGAHNVSHVQAVPAQEIPRVEPAILDRSRRLLAALPVEACDLLIVDRLGKDVSGGGMDGNVIGRMLIDGEPEPAAPRVGLLLARRLTAASHGNATGIGYADLVTQQLVDAMDDEITRVNVTTSGFPLRGRVPPVLPNDRTAVERALELLAQRGAMEPTVLRIRDTLSLVELQVSANLLPELLERPGVELLAAPAEMRFDGDGALM